MSLKRGHAAYTRDTTAHSALLPREGGTSGYDITFASDRSLAAAKSRPGSSRARKVKEEDDSGNESDTTLDKVVKTRKKAEPVKSACVQCQKRKTKCSGQRPTCRFCSDRDLECSWEITAGMTRTADLKQKLQDATGKSEDLDLLIDALRSGSDNDSTMLLARLRLGTSVEDLARSLRLEPSSTDSADSPSETVFSQLANSSDRPLNGSPGSSSPTSLSSTRKDSHFSLQMPTNESKGLSSRDYQATSPHSFLTQDFEQARMTWKPSINGSYGLGTAIQPNHGGGGGHGSQLAQRRESDAMSLAQSPTMPPTFMNLAG